MADDCLDFVKGVWAAYLDYGGFNAHAMSTMSVVSAEPGLVICSMKIVKSQINRNGTLHGGMICSLIDTVGSLALSSKGMAASGVSTDIHTTFLRAGGSEGDTIRLEGRVLQLGRNMAYTEVKLVDANNGKLLATGLHNKYVTNAINSPKNVKFDDAGRVVSPADKTESAP